MIYFSLGAFGHVVPSLPLVRAMIDRGHEVIYYSGSKLADTVKNSGAEFRRYSGAIDVFGVTTTPRSAAFHGYAMARSVYAMLGEELERLRQEQPDFVVHDSVAPWGKVIAQALGVPAVAFAPLFVHNTHTEEWMNRVQAPTSAPEDPSNRANRGYALRTVKVLSQVNSKLRQIGVPALSLRDYARAYEDLTIVCTSQLFQPSGTSFGEEFVFAGPLMDEVHEVRTATRAPETRSIYVSLGTTNFNRDLRLYRVLLEALGKFEGRVVMTMGGRLQASNLGEIPENIELREFIPADEELDVIRNADAIVNHAGFSTLHKCLYFGVPMVAIPLLMEHARAAQRLTELRAGIHMDRSEVSEERLSGALRRVLEEPQYRENAVRIGRSFRNSGGTGEAVRRILRYVGLGDDGHGRSLPPGAVTTTA